MGSKTQPPVKNISPVEVNLPELICEHGLNPLTCEHSKAVGDLVMIVFYYLLRCGEYCVNTKEPGKKQTVQFRVKDVTFFKRDVGGRLRQLPKKTPDWMLCCADSATLNISNQKNGHKNVCVNQESNGKSDLCLVCALARRTQHVR